MSEVQKVGRDVRLSVSIEGYEVVQGAGDSRDSGAMGQAVSALKARISLAQTGQHVLYTLRVVFEREAWSLKKRFSEVAAVHEVLQRRVPGLPSLPAKSAVRQFGAEYLDARKASLTAYFQELCKRRDVLNCVEVQQFFGLTERVPAFRQPHASEPMQTAEVHEATFGISAFIYDPMQGLLLLGATDRSWTSRMDTKITNIKLPWESSAPNLPSSQMSLWRQSPADLRFEMLSTSRYTATLLCCALLPATGRDKGMCLCGLSDGTVGFLHLQGQPGVNTGGTLPLVKHTAAVSALAVDDAEGWVISASKDNALKVYDSRKQLLMCEVQTATPTTRLLYAQPQRRLFCGLQSGRVAVWDLSLFPIQQVAAIPDGAEPSLSKIAALDFDLASSTLFTASAHGFTVWAVKASSAGVWGRRAGQISGLTGGRPTAVAWASSSRELLVGYSTGAVVIFDVDAGVPSYAIQAHLEEITDMMWLDAPRRLLTSSADKTLKIWDFPSLRRTPLEEQAAFAYTAAPTSEHSVSTSSASGGPRRPPVAASSLQLPGTDPLLGRPAGGTSFPGSAGSPLASAAGGLRPANPLAVSGSRESVAAAASPLAAAPRPANPLEREAAAAAVGYPGGYAAGHLAAPAPARASAPPPVPPAEVPRASGRSPALNHDSDDELAGWDK